MKARIHGAPPLGSPQVTCQKLLFKENFVHVVGHGTMNEVKQFVWVSTQTLKDAFKARKEAPTGQIETLMKLTLHDRREMVLNGASVKEVIEKYPWIAKSPELFLEEFRRITKIDLDKELIAFLNMYGNSILMMSRYKIKVTGLLLQGLQEKGSEMRNTE